MRHVTWPIMGRGKMFHIFEIPEINTFSLSLSGHCEVQSKLVCKMLVFLQNLGLIIFNWIIGTSKKHILHRNERMTFAVVSCKNPKSEHKTSHPPPEHIKLIVFLYLGSRNPWNDRDKILHVGCRIMHSNFGEDQLRGFGMVRSRIFGLFPRLASSPLQHSHYHVILCKSLFTWDLWQAFKFNLLTAAAQAHLINVDLWLGWRLEKCRVPLTSKILSLVFANDTLVLQVALVANQNHGHLTSQSQET